MNLLTPEYEKWSKTAKKALIDKETTVMELAKQLGINKLYISSALSGRRPDERVIKRMSEYLGITAP